MTYPAVKALMEENPKITRKEVMKAVNCGELQAAAWMQRFVAEKAALKAKDSDPFVGKYRGGKDPKKVRPVGDKLPVKKRVTRSGRIIG